MGNAESNEERPTATGTISSPSSNSDDEDDQQDEAKFRREMMELIRRRRSSVKVKFGEADGGVSPSRRSSFVSFLEENDDSTTNNDLKEEVENLQSQVNILSERCASLEAQNILVSVQILDMLARGMAWTCSILSTLLYCKGLFWVMNKLLYPLLQDWLVVDDATEVGLLLLHSIPWMILKILLCFVPYLYNRWTFGSVHRRFEVFSIAFIVIFRVRACRWRERLFMTTTTPTTTTTSSNEKNSTTTTIPKFGQDMSNDAIWEANYEISARFLYVSILRLKGLWTKSAQYLSSRADFMPTSYVRELSRLQDEAPATDWEDVKRMIPKKVLKELVDIDPIPLASASIGQVHVAHLATNKPGQEKKVVIKVQHPHAQTLIGDDFWSLKVIARIISWMEPEYEFFEILMKEWAKEAQKELDFRIEAKNLWDAKHSIAQMMNKEGVVHTSNNNSGSSGCTPTPFQVEIPTPYNDLSNRSVLVMSFCEGKRVDNLEQLKEWGIEREHVMDAVAQTFAHQMYATDIFNGDPHPGNLFIRKGTTLSPNMGLTLVLLDWGLAKRLTEQKRIAFCQIAYAAATFDYGLLLDSFKTIGLKIKKENVAESMEGVRFVLRDLAPRDKARRRIKSRIKSDRARFESRPKDERVPMESKTYPGEFFFFVRVNELIHGLGSKFNVDMNYLDVLRPYAEEGLRKSPLYQAPPPSRPAAPVVVESKDQVLHQKLEEVLGQMDCEEDSIAGAQVCVLDRDGDVLVNVVGGTLGGLKQHIPMSDDALILGYSCTKATAATIAHRMVQEGYLTYDEPICERVWPAFCPTKEPPKNLYKYIEEDDLSAQDIVERWQWKRSITLRHVLTHQAGLWFALPFTMTIKLMASCEACAAAFEYIPEVPENTLLPNRKPGEAVEYHFMSFGWLVAGTVMGAYAVRHKLPKESVTYEQVYQAILEPKLSEETKRLGFRPCGGTGDHPVALTVTKDISASRMLQMRRESIAMGEEEQQDDEEKSSDNEKVKLFRDLYKNFKGKEFLLDPRVWNCEESLGANVPAAGGRFTARGLASFYRDLGSGNILNAKTLELVSHVTGGVNRSAAGSALQGATSMTTNDGDSDLVELGCGYQLIRFEGDSKDLPPTGFGHAGVGGSIGLYHKPTGMGMALMLNKADGGKDQTMRIMRIVADHFDLGKL